MADAPIQPGLPAQVSGGIAAPNAAATVRFDEADFKARLIDEYKILQDKIDKIGGFRFTIKGWSVTAVIAASAASTTAQRLGGWQSLCPFFDRTLRVGAAPFEA